MVNVSEAQDLIGQLDIAEEVPLYYRIPEHRLNQDGTFHRQYENGQIAYIPPEGTVKGSKGVWNTNTGSFAAVVSDGYSLMQHGDVFGVVLNQIGNLDKNSLFAVENDGNIARLEVLFPDIIIPDDSKEGIQLGMRFVNSFDKSTGANGEFFGFRQTCSNGMYLERIFGKVSFGMRHVGNKDLIDEWGVVVTDFVESILQTAHSTLQPIIEEAISSEVDFGTEDIRFATIKEIVGTNKATEAIAEKVPLQTTRWDIYNAMTDVATHLDVTHSTRDHIERRAEKHVLIPKQIRFAAPIPVMA
jgi:hypothetical protein